MVNIVVLYQFTVTCTENLASNVEAWGLSDGKEKRFKIAIMFSGRRRRSTEERNGFLKADVKWVIVYMYFLLLNPFATIVYARSAFFSQSAVLILHFAPILRFTLSLQSAFYP